MTNFKNVKCYANNDRGITIVHDDSIKREMCVILHNAHIDGLNVIGHLTDDMSFEEKDFLPLDVQLNGCYAQGVKLSNTSFHTIVMRACGCHPVDILAPRKQVLLEVRLQETVLKVQKDGVTRVVFDDHYLGLFTATEEESKTFTPGLDVSYETPSWVVERLPEGVLPGAECYDTYPSNTFVYRDE